MFARLPTATIATVLAIATALPASALTTRHGVRVNPVGGGVFEAIANSSIPEGHFWCAASEYARRKLNAGWSDQIYLVRGLGPSVTTNRKSAVHFSLKYAGEPAGKSGLFKRLEVGSRRSVQQGNNECYQSLIPKF